MFLHTLRNKHCLKLKKLSSQSTLFYQSFHQLAPQALTPFNFSMSMAITCVNAHFCESISKNPYRGKPNEKQGPKAYQEDQRAKEVQRKKCKGKGFAAEYKSAAEYSSLVGWLRQTKTNWAQDPFDPVNII